MCTGTRLHRWGREAAATARKANTANQDSEEFQLPQISKQQQGGGNSFPLFLPPVNGDLSSAAFLSCPQVPHQTRYCRHQILGWQEPQQLLVSIRSALNPPGGGQHHSDQKQLHPKLGAAQRQSSREDRGSDNWLRELAGWNPMMTNVTSACTEDFKDKAHSVISREAEQTSLSKKRKQSNILWSHQDHTPPSHA